MNSVLLFFVDLIAIQIASSILSNHFYRKYSFCFLEININTFDGELILVFILNDYFIINNYLKY